PVRRSTIRLALQKPSISSNACSIAIRYSSMAWVNPAASMLSQVQRTQAPSPDLEWRRGRFTLLRDPQTRNGSCAEAWTGAEVPDGAPSPGAAPLVGDQWWKAQP